MNICLIFNSAEELAEYGRRQSEKALVKSGILCLRRCYKWEDDLRKTDPMNKCMLLLPQKVYNGYEQNTRKEDKDYRSTAKIAVIHPGIIRVRYEQNGKKSYVVEEGLCKRSLDVENLLERYLGQKIRLSKNLLVKVS